MPSPSSAPVVVVGAGLAGLACAQRLSRAGVEVVVFEGADAVGGRVRTDVVDGFRCDRGFQLLNPAYPVLRHVVDLAELDLHAFAAGVVVATGDQRYVLADPRREPARLAQTLLAPLGSLADKLRFARWAAGSLRPVRRILSRTDRTVAADLDDAGISGILRTGVVEPFLAGVLAEDDQASSANFVALLLRSFVLGSPAVPSLGMQRLPELIAASLPAGTVRLGTSVVGVSASSVRTADAEHPARAVVVATDPTAAAALAGVEIAPTKALTTFWHAAREAPTRERLLHLDADRRGPVINSAVLTTVAPSYAPAGQSLIATTVLGCADEADLERLVRRQAGIMYGVEASGWELLTRQVVTQALPEQRPPLEVRRRAVLPNGVFVAGDHRETASIQGALVSGRRVAAAVLAARSGLVGQHQER